MTNTDEQLMLDVQGGSREAFEELFERYRARMGPSVILWLAILAWPARMVWRRLGRAATL